MDTVDQIHAANARFTEAVRAKDAAAMPALYTTDGKILPPNDDMVSGDEAIVAFWQGLFDIGLADARPVTHEIIAMDDLSVEVGEFSVYGDDGTRLDNGKIMVVWKLEDGDWKMHRDMWCSSLPLPDAGA